MQKLRILRGHTPNLISNLKEFVVYLEDMVRTLGRPKEFCQ